MTRREFLALLVLVVSCGDNPAAPPGEQPPDWYETFTVATGTLPPDWYRSQGEGEGIYWVSSGHLSHMTPGQCGYYYTGATLGSGTYELDIYGLEGWEFAWRISGDSLGGLCRRLVVNSFWSPFPTVALIGAGAWSGAGYPWQDSDWSSYSDAPYGGTASAQHVEIWDTGEYVRVTINGSVVLESVVPDIPAGMVGVGCVGDVGVIGGAPWYDNLAFVGGAP